MRLEGIADSVALERVHKLEVKGMCLAALDLRRSGVEGPILSSDVMMDDR
jgi:hypothetical protein